MDDKFKKLCERIIDIKYSKQDLKVKLHEDDVVNILNEIGFECRTIMCRRDQEKVNLLVTQYIPSDNIKILGFENNTYIYQPFGTQNSPDFIFFFNDTYIIVELKSGKTDTIIWSNHIPQKNWIYIFSLQNKKISGTTYFMGQDLISDEFREHLEKTYQEKREKSKKELNDEVFNHPSNIWEFNDYVRPMLVCNTKYFRNIELRKEREKNVSTFIKNIYRQTKKELSTKTYTIVLEKRKRGRPKK